MKFKSFLYPIGEKTHPKEQYSVGIYDKYYVKKRITERSMILEVWIRKQQLFF